jgi:hypothetical protein
MICVGWVEVRNPTVINLVLGNACALPNLQVVTNQPDMISLLSRDFQAQQLN